MEGGARGIWSWVVLLACRQFALAGLARNFSRFGNSSTASGAGSTGGWVPLTHKGHCRVSSGPVVCPTSCAAMAAWLAVINSANSNSVKGDRLRMPVVYIEVLENAGKDLKDDDPSS